MFYVVKKADDRVYFWSPEYGIEVLTLEELQLMRQVRIKGKKNRQFESVFTPVRQVDCGDMYVKELITTSQGTRACIVANNINSCEKRMSRSDIKKYLESSRRSISGVLITDKGVGLKVVDKPQLVGAELL